jgi:hypothetical protein
VELLQELIDNYFVKCDAHTKSVLDKRGQLVEISDPIPYTLSGLAVHLNCDRDTLLNYSHKEEYFGTIKRAKDRCLADSEERLFTHFTPGIIFNLKNNFGWKDKIEVDTNKNMVISVVQQHAFTEDD